MSAEAEFSTWIGGEFFEFFELWELEEFLETHEEAEVVAAPWLEATEEDEDVFEEDEAEEVEED